MPAREGCALVTGSSRGIGAAIASRLAADGWPVGVNSRSEESAAAVVGEIRHNGGEAIAVPGDVSQPADVSAVFECLEDRFGKVAVLVNNAGISADGLSLQLGDDDWHSVMGTNLFGAFLTTRRALRPMVRTRFGRIVNLASIVGPRANPGQANYAASKAGLIGFTKTVAAEVAKRGVTVNAVAPGFIATDMTEGLEKDVAEFVPAKRAGTADEVAACVRFLVSDDASYVTGATLTVDGGLSG